jgi:hypothetical protein
LEPFSREILAGFSQKQILLVRTVGDSRNLEVGFRLFGSTIIQCRVPEVDLVSLGWSTGQASEMAGRDVNDWSVVLWCLHHDLQKEAREREHHYRRPGQMPVIIGPSRSKVATEALGQRVISFLREAGISVTIEATKPLSAA